MRYTAYIGLGSNLGSAAGDPAETVRVAMNALGALGIVTAVSSLYRTAPVGLREQPYFINAVARLETEFAPEALLRELLAVERRFGRERRESVPKGPRTLDLDLLLAVSAAGEAVVIEKHGLTLPHPEMTNRRFVLEPLAELAPELRHPLLGGSIQDLLDGLTARKGDGNEEVQKVQALREGSAGAGKLTSS